MLDPLVYSTQPTLQLFALSVRNMYHEANDEVQNFINEFKEGYDKFKQFKGSDTNPNSFNEDLLETISKLLDIEQTSVEVKEDQKKWNKFREICDSYDAEMEKHIKKIQEQK